jgi:hypothetical protein
LSLLLSLPSSLSSRPDNDAKEEAAQKMTDNINDKTDSIRNNNDIMTTEEMATKQANLHHKVSYLMRALYRQCLGLVNLLAGGNDGNARDFMEREANEQRNQLPSSPEDDRPPHKGREEEGVHGHPRGQGEEAVIEGGVLQGVRQGELQRALRVRDGSLTC